jgi:hypothetical protein
MTRFKSIRAHMSARAEHRITRRAAKKIVKRTMMEIRLLLKIWHNYPIGFLRSCVRDDFR